jgi:hypothetical protein
VSDGYLALDWIDGRPVRRAETAEPSFLEAVASYQAGRARQPHFRAGRSVDTLPLIRALEENAHEVLGPDPPGLVAALARLAELPEREAVVPDARMQPREWLRDSAGTFHKVDSLDHGEGLRLPGPTDAAWDIAAAAVEYQLAPSMMDRLVERCATANGAVQLELGAAAAAYRPAYAACLLGDVILSSWEASPDDDKRRLEAEAAWYRAALIRELGHP